MIGTIDKNAGATNFYKVIIITYNRMSNKLEHELQLKSANRFMGDQKDDSDNNSQQSQDYYEYQRKRMEMALSLLKTRQNNSILQQLKRNTNNEIQYMDQFQDQVNDLHKITRNNEKNVLQESVIKQIKQKVFNQSMLNTIQLADQELQKKKQKLQIIEKQAKVNSQAYNIQNNKIKQAENKLLKKMQNAKMQRQLAEMGRQDERSMKYQIEFLSNFFSQRNFNPQFKVPKTKKANMLIPGYAPKATITHLKPLPNTENNVLPRNAPELALRRLGRSKKIAFKSTSMSQITVKYKKLNPQKQEQSQQKTVRKDRNEKDEVQKSMESYLEFIKPFLSSIDSACKNYKPKFINEFPNQNEQNYNIDNDQSQSRTIQECLNVEKPTLIKDIKLTFQHINSLKGIDRFANVEQAALQFNVISNLNTIQNCSKLIQINLSHNKLKNASSLKDLKWLKILNLQHNLIQSIQCKGGSLQILNVSHNRIQQIIDLSSNVYLKRLLINNNNLHKLSGLKNHLLEELDAHSNFLKDLTGIQQCILLRTLDVSHNRLSSLHKNFTFIFLTKLMCCKNSLSELPNMFLPSLQQLYLDHNKIQVEPTSQLYFPNLRVLNLDNNLLSGFSVVWAFIRYSCNLETLRYEGNQYFADIRDKVKELYQFIIYNNMTKLKILNQGAYDIGVKKYYEGVYGHYLANKTIFKPESVVLQQIHKKIGFVIQQNQFMSSIQDRHIKFTETNIYVRFKSVKKAEDLMEIIAFLSNKQGGTILHAAKSLFYQHDKFEYKMRDSLHKIKSLIVRKQYLIQKRRKHFRNNKHNLKNLLKFIDDWLLKQNIIRAIKSFHFPLQKMGEEKAAIIIQKNWRCYSMRKRYLKIIKNIRKKDDEFELQDFNLDDYNFENVVLEQFQFQFPEDIDFQQYIIRPEIFQMLSQQEITREKKMAIDKQNNSRVEKKQNNQNDRNQMRNNFVQQNESRVTERTGANRQMGVQEELEKIMKQWGVSRQAAMLLLKKKRNKQKQKQKYDNQHMSAAQRYQKFKKQR